jgi:hypothetical protein
MGIGGLWDVKFVDWFRDMGLEEGMGMGRGFEEVNPLVSLPCGNQVVIWE